MNTVYIVKVMCVVGPGTVLVFGMGFQEADERDLRAEHFRAAMEAQATKPGMHLFAVDHIGGQCCFFGHQIVGVVCETYNALENWQAHTGVGELQ